MEWSGEQQLGFLLRSAVPGMGIGFLLDINSGLWRGKKYRRQLYAADAIAGILAALITFFGALVIMDGQLHPVLFCGLLLGVLSEHYFIGRWLSFILWKARLIWLRLLSKMGEHMKKTVRKYVTNRPNVVPKWRKKKKCPEKP